jgi:hypothetical protein
VGFLVRVSICELKVHGNIIKGKEEEATRRTEEAETDRD